MSTTSGVALYESMNAWVSRDPEEIARQYLEFVDYAWASSSARPKGYFSAAEMDAMVIRGGLIGETGELAEEIKKGIRSCGAKWRAMEILLELGDVLFYAARAALNYGRGKAAAALAKEIQVLTAADGTLKSGDYIRTVRDLEQRLLWTPETSKTQAARTLYVSLLLHAEEIALAAADLSRALRNPETLTSHDVLRTFYKAGRFCQALDVDFRDVFVLNASKVIERKAKVDGVAPEEALLAMMRTIDRP